MVCQGLFAVNSPKFLYRLELGFIDLQKSGGLNVPLPLLVLPALITIFFAYIIVIIVVVVAVISVANADHQLNSKQS